MIPYRMNMVDVEISQLERSTKIQDKDYRYSLGKHHPTTITIKAQINYRYTEKQAPSMTGDQEVSGGRIVARKSSIDAAGYVIEEGDLITSVAGLACEYKIIEVTGKAHLRGRPNTLHIEFINNKYKRESVI